MLKVPLNLPDTIKGKRIVLVRCTGSMKVAREMYDGLVESFEPQAEWCPFFKKDDVNSVHLYLKKCVVKWKKGILYEYHIRDKKTNRFLGTVDLHRLRTYSAAVEIGYWLRESATGNGYCQEAIGLLESVAFKAGVNRLEMSIDELNTKSNKVAHACGYHLDGVMRQGSWIPDLNKLNDYNVYSKLKSEWKSKSVLTKNNTSFKVKKK